MDNKIMIMVNIPDLGKKIDIIIPISRKVGNIKKDLIMNFNSNFSKIKLVDTDYNFFKKSNGAIILNDCYVANSGITSGEEILLLHK